MDQRELDDIAANVWAAWTQDGALVEPERWAASRVLVHRIVCWCAEDDSLVTTTQLMRRVLATLNRDAVSVLRC